MKTLLKILLGGFVAFQLLAIGDEWSFFSESWFGGEEDGPRVELAEADRRAALETVRLTLELMRHLYLSAGDPRFAERIPASEAVKEEMVADAEYLANNHRLQDPELLRWEVAEVEVLGEDRLRVRTLESWRFRIFWVTGAGDAEPPRERSLAGTYLVARGARGWRVESWAWEEPARPEPAA